MDELLYNKAISLCSKGEYEEALALIQTSSIAMSKECQGLIHECEKLILEQHIYLIKEYIEQQDYHSAIRKKEKYKAKFGLNPRIENIIIPSSPIVNSKEHTEHQLPNSRNQQSTNRKAPFKKPSRKKLIIVVIIILSLIGLLAKNLPYDHVL